MDWSHVDYFIDYYDVFITCLNSHSDGTHSLQTIHLVSEQLCNARFLQIWRNKLFYILNIPLMLIYSYLFIWNIEKFEEGPLFVYTNCCQIIFF